MYKVLFGANNPLFCALPPRAILRSCAKLSRAVQVYTENAPSPHRVDRTMSMSDLSDAYFMIMDDAQLSCQVGTSGTSLVLQRAKVGPAKCLMIEKWKFNEPRSCLHRASIQFSPALEGTGLSSHVELSGPQ